MHYSWRQRFICSLLFLVISTHGQFEGVEDVPAEEDLVEIHIGK